MAAAAVSQGSLVGNQDQQIESLSEQIGEYNRLIASLFAEIERANNNASLYSGQIKQMKELCKTAQEERAKAQAELRRLTNVIRGASIGAGVGAGAVILAHTFVVPVSAPVAIAAVAVGAIAGAACGERI